MNYDHDADIKEFDSKDKALEYLSNILKCWVKPDEYDQYSKSKRI